MADFPAARARSIGPGIALILLAVLYGSVCVLGLAMLAVGAGINVVSATTASGTQPVAAVAVQLAFSAVGALLDVVGIVAAAIIGLGGLRLIALRSPTIVSVAAVVAIVQPVVETCTSVFSGCSCCGPMYWMPLAVFGVAGGAWALATLNDPVVREAFDTDDVLPEF